MATQRITIEVNEEADGVVRWKLIGATGKRITDSSSWGDKMPCASLDTAFLIASKAARECLHVERSC